MKTAHPKNGMKTSFSEWYGNAGMKTRVRKGYENDKSKANKPREEKNMTANRDRERKTRERHRKGEAPDLAPVYENTVWKHVRKHPYENMV